MIVPPSNEEIVHIAENIELVYEPGTQFQYCNLGYDILAYITETVSGVPFEEYVTNEILQPIGMTHSGYHIPTTQGYRWLFRRLLPYDEPESVLTSGDGGLRSTPKDMSLWIEAQLGHLELPEKLKSAITASKETPEAYKIDMGNGIFVILELKLYRLRSFAGNEDLKSRSWEKNVIIIQFRSIRLPERL